MRALAILLLAAAALAPAAGAQPLEVARRGPAAVDADAGTVTLAFLLRNRGPLPAEGELRVRTPAGVRTLLPPARRHVEPGATELVLVPVRVGEALAAGRYTVRLEAGGGGADSVQLVVAPRRALAAEAVMDGAMVVAGEPYTARFRVRNAGNTPERITLHATDDGGIRGEGPREAVLAPGEEIEAGYLVRTAGLGHRNLRRQVTLRTSAGDGVEAVARSVVEVVPRGVGPRLPGAGLPVEATVRTDGSGRTGYDVKGARGALAFRFRTGDPSGAAFARPAERFLSLRTRRLRLQAGDGWYGVSGLQGSRVRGTGGEGEARLGTLAAGGFAEAGDGARPGRRGGFLRLGSERAGVGTIHDGGASLEGWLRPGRMLHGRAELALPQGGSTPARDLRLSGASQAFGYELRHLRVRPDADPRLHHDAAAVSVRVFGGLQASGGYRRGWAAAPDTARGLPPPRESARLRVDAWRRAHLEARAWSDAGGISAFRALRAGAAVPLGPVTLAPAGEWGEVRGGSGPPVPFRAAELRATVARRNASLTTTLRREETAAVRWTGGVHGALPLTPGLALRLSASGARLDGEGPAAGYADAEVEQRLGRGHSLLLRGAGEWGGRVRRKPQLAAAYRITLPLPLPGGRPAGGLTVRVLDAVEGRPLAGVAVRAGGRTALTGRDGVALLQDVPPGTHLVRVQRTDAGAPWISRGGGGVEVQVPERGGARAGVEVAAAGSVAGRVLRVPSGGGASEPLSGVQVLLRTTGRELRATTGSDGRFRFDGLWPGWWRAALLPASLPRHHEPRETGQPVLVRPAAETEAELAVVERERRLRMTGGGEVGLEP